MAFIEEDYEDMQYEQNIVRDALVLFFGGQGGSPKEPEVRTQVGLWLRPYFLQGYEITERENPLRADLIWWKGDRVAVVEIGVKVSRDDVEPRENTREHPASSGDRRLPCRDWRGMGNARYRSACTNRRR
jgi:hypothetical protein